MLINERRTKNDVTFHEDEVNLAKAMMDKSRTTMEFLYYLMEHRGKMSFTTILLSTNNLKLEYLLQKWKRQTDILIEIDKENNLYMIICQSTDREGGKMFAEILMSNIQMNGGSDTYCVESELISTEHTMQEVIFTMVEKYVYIKQKKQTGKVFFTNLKHEEPGDNDSYIVYK